MTNSDPNKRTAANSRKMINATDKMKAAAVLLAALRRDKQLYEANVPIRCQRFKRTCRKSEFDSGVCPCARQDRKDAAATWDKYMSNT